jgi:hypothetical protein
VRNQGDFVEQEGVEEKASNCLKIKRLKVISLAGKQIAFSGWTESGLQAHPPLSFLLWVVSLLGPPVIPPIPFFEKC